MLYKTRQIPTNQSGNWLKKDKRINMNKIHNCYCKSPKPGAVPTTNLFQHLFLPTYWEHSRKDKNDVWAATNNDYNNWVMVQLLFFRWIDKSETNKKKHLILTSLCQNRNF